MKLPASLALAVLVTACAGGPVGGGGNGPYAPPGGSTYERQVIAALSETKASPEQRAAVLAAFDKLGPALKENDAAERRLQRSWAALDPKSAGYAAEADALAIKAGAQAAERLKALAGFNRSVAATLEGSEWARWSRLMNDERAAFENARQIDPTYRPGER